LVTHGERVKQTGGEFAGYVLSKAGLFTPKMPDSLKDGVDIGFFFLRTVTYVIDDYTPTVALALAALELVKDGFSIQKATTHLLRVKSEFTNASLSQRVAYVFFFVGDVCKIAKITLLLFSAPLTSIVAATTGHVIVFGALASPLGLVGVIAIGVGLFIPFAKEVVLWQYEETAAKTGQVQVFQPPEDKID